MKRSMTPIMANSRLGTPEFGDHFASLGGRNSTSGRDTYSGGRCPSVSSVRGMSPAEAMVAENRIKARHSSRIGIRPQCTMNMVRIDTCRNVDIHFQLL